jgi:creatinine amidohydrolase
MRKRENLFFSSHNRGEALYGHFGFDRIAASLCSRAKFLRLFGILLMTAVATFTSLPAFAQDRLPVRWQALTAPEFIHAIQQAQGVCMLPFGIMEKHGPHLPLGTDLYDIRYMAVHAAEQDYAVVFPPYYFGEIFEARQQPGAVAYSVDIQWRLLQETTNEMARNGCKKVIIANGHGGNSYFLPYFAQAQLASGRNYVVYIWDVDNVNLNRPGRPPLKHPHDGHAGEAETSLMLVARPDLVHLGQLNLYPEQWRALHRLHLSPPLFTGISWYANFPNHYAGDASAANEALGKFDMETYIHSLVAAIRSVKADSESLKLQNAFYKHATHPLETPQTGTWWIK